MLMVLASGRGINKQLTITVTKYNKFAPALDLQHYSAEVVATAGVGTRLTTVTAQDQDQVEYNRDIHYFLADPLQAPFNLNPFLDPPAGSQLRMEPRTGVVKVASALPPSTSTLRLLVGAVDGGSPQRHALANLTIYIRDMPEPRLVIVTNASESSLTVCWSPPALGTPDGYLLSYIPVDSHSSPREGFLNLTMEQLHKNVSTWSNDQQGAPARGDKVVVFRYCAVVGDLLGWTQYLVGVRAWAGLEISVAANPVKGTTMRDHCAEDACRVGSCRLHQDPPGYSCQCPTGYYGDNCEHHNPCLPDNPCNHLGRCFNRTDGSYVCECMHGMYGPNCTLMDPCVAVAANPCINGGSCISETSHQYECLCPDGYYGVTCEHRNLCLPHNPCQHGGSCTNLTHTTFSCGCPPGYTGKKCEEEINECEPNPCKAGECTDLLDDYHCQCPQGWGGKHCGQDLESCPAQTTHLSTGEFLWPATHHGEYVTIACPYGTRTPATEDRSTPETAAFPQIPTPATNRDNVWELEEPASSMATPQDSRMSTTYAEWEGGSFQISRKTRDVFPSRMTIYDHNEDDFQERRQRILSSLRGVSPRRSQRRHHSQRQSKKGGQWRHGTQRQDGKRLESFTSTESERHLHNARQTDSKADRGQEPDLKKHMKTETGTSGDLKIGAHSKTAPHTSALLTKEPYSKPESMGNANESTTNPLIQNMSQIHPSLISEENENLELTGNADHQGKNENIPENTTLQMNKTMEIKSDSTDMKNLEKKIVSGIYLSPGALQMKRSDKPIRSGRAVRFCLLLPNGTVVWREPDTSVCREEAVQAAGKVAEELALLTASPSNIDSEMFMHAADQLAKIVNQAVKDPAVASNMVYALSNMMEVNDSVVAAVQGVVTRQILQTINTFTQNVALEAGKSINFGSQHLVVEARLLDSSLKENITFCPEGNDPSPSHSSHRQKRNIDSSTSTQELKPYISLPPEVLKLTGSKNVRLEFVSYANDKFFRSQHMSGLPIISAKITNTKVSNLSHPVLYHIPLAASHTSESVRPRCVFWDEKEHEWSSEGLKMVQVDGRTLCQASHLTAFSILLDPLPAHLGTHADTLSIITYVGLVLSTAALMATVATYALFRTLNRDRSGKIVMNLSLVLLLLNIMFIIAVNLEPPSVACIALAAVLHYLVVAAFAWMLVEAANMYQLLITVFASAETHFMAKRVCLAWGLPVILVVIALTVDKDIYGDPDHGHCVISPVSNPALYYSTYLGPICLVLLVNCVVFVMVTRVLCQRRPRSNKPKAASSSPSLELPITLAQVRGAVTVVALLGITWVFGALGLGGARLILQYIFCLTTPLQGLIIFIVRVAQHPEARDAWKTLFTTGKLRRRRPPNTHYTQSSSHTQSTLSTTNTPRYNHSSTHTTSTRISPRMSIKPTVNAKKNGSVKSWNAKNGSISNYVSKNGKGQEINSTMGTIFARLVKRLSNSGHEKENDELSVPKNIQNNNPDVASVTHPELECESTLNQEQSYFCEVIPEKPSRSSYKNKPLHRPQSLVLLRTDSHGSVMATHSSTLSSHDCINPQFPLLSSNFLPQELIEAGIPSSLVPRRSLGSLMLTAGGKEGDDSSWHFVRPPPDGHSNTVSEGESVLVGSDHIVMGTKVDRDYEELGSQKLEASELRNSSGCIVLAGQRVATNTPAVSGELKRNSAPNLFRANSELQMSSSVIHPADLRRSASVYTLGEWEDPRSSLA
ncbi:Adhesion G-protein coupled receptor G6 [Chionoecetes opilio]|uniref:Adhesion G-protein coupled receptor G6 n=1 Tax=Chionoecetes opilio TaxID=41210 RepID=A0A8J4XWH2_CHIOP|nr:Adhesion G-protein coupled receptor G6 [Chionoecetes opilio]